MGISSRPAEDGGSLGTVLSGYAMKEREARALLGRLRSQRKGSLCVTSFYVIHAHEPPAIAARLRKRFRVGDFFVGDETRFLKAPRTRNFFRQRSGVKALNAGNSILLQIIR